VDAKTTSIEARVREALGRVLATWELRNKAVPLIKLRAAVVGKDDVAASAILSLQDLSEALARGERIVLEAPAGSGKTTTLTQLAQQELAAGHIPFPIDLPQWVEDDSSILRFIAGLPPFQALEVGPGDLARLPKEAHLSFLLNGWNEVGASDIRSASLSIQKLEQEFPDAGIILASRAHRVAILRDPKLRIRLLPLSWVERETYVTQRLGDRAMGLIEQLNSDSVLDGLTSTPLILAHVTSLFEKDRQIPTTKFGILRDVVLLIESSPAHRLALDETPLSGMARVYLEELSSWLTSRGQVLLPENAARAVVGSTAERLKDACQIAEVPQPSDVLGELCASHVLERAEAKTVGFRFSHQQFQEFFAAQRIMHELHTLSSGTASTTELEFASTYLNEPAWTEVFFMIAAEIGHAVEGSSDDDAFRAGVMLIRSALQVDLLFACGLAQHGGPRIWTEVGQEVGTRLRELCASPVAKFRDYALAAMIATDAPDFVDVLVPLLTASDRRKHHSTYRLTSEFHMTSLGPDWKDTVRSWAEEARVDFAGHVFSFKLPQEEVASFFLADHSAKVRAAALSGLLWFGALYTKPAIAGSIDEEALREVLRHRPLETVPRTLRPRVLPLYEETYRGASDPVAKLKTLLDLSRLGYPSAAAEMKVNLSSLNTQQVRFLAQYDLEPILESIRDADGVGWLGQWVRDQMFVGALEVEHWMTWAAPIESEQIESLLQQFVAEDFSVGSHPGVIPILRAHVDVAAVRRLFQRARDLDAQIEAAHHRDCEKEVHIRTQIVEFLQSLSLGMVVTGIIESLRPGVDSADLSLIIALWGRVGNNDRRFREEIPEETRESLRRYLKSAIPPTIAAEDPRGERKCGLAVVLAQIGVPEDMGCLEQLIAADLDRMRQPRRAMLCHTDWYLHIARQLDEGRAAALALKLLREPEYELPAAWSLVRLAMTATPPPTPFIDHWFNRDRDQRELWQVRNASPSTGFHEARRESYVKALRAHIDALLEKAKDPKQKDSAQARLKNLAKPLAALDAHGSKDVIFQILELPMAKHGNWDGWNRALTLEIMLFAGVALPAERTRAIIAPIIDIPKGQWQSDNDKELTGHALALLPFVDVPSVGIATVADWLKESRIHFGRLSRVVKALGNSRAPEVLPLLVAIGNDQQYTTYLGDVWIDAVFTLNTPEANDLLMSFVDPSLSGLPEDNGLRRNDVLSKRLADLVNREPSYKQRLFDLTERDLPQPRKKILAETLAKLQDDSALLASLNLLDDHAQGTLPYEIYEQIERAFVEHKPQAGSTNVYTLAPRSANALRRKLMQMAAGDDRRRGSALSLLAQAEEWRLQYGRPNGEMRNPVLGSGNRWPPATPEEIQALAPQLTASGQVLILGKDTGDGLLRLKEIQRKLVDLGYKAVLIKEQPDVIGETVLQKVLRYAANSKFVVMDNTEASGHLYEAAHVWKAAEYVTAVLQQRGRGATWMTEEIYFRNNHLQKFEFEPHSIGLAVEQATAWAEQFRKRFGDYQVSVLPWLTNR
jgi:hypothetical protein